MVNNFLCDFVDSTKPIARESSNKMSLGQKIATFVVLDDEESDPLSTNPNPTNTRNYNHPQARINIEENKPHSTHHPRNSIFGHNFSNSSQRSNIFIPEDDSFVAKPPYSRLGDCETVSPHFEETPSKPVYRNDVTNSFIYPSSHFIPGSISILPETEGAVCNNFSRQHNPIPAQIFPPRTETSSGNVKLQERIDSKLRCSSAAQKLSEERAKIEKLLAEVKQREAALLAREQQSLNNRESLKQKETEPKSKLSSVIIDDWLSDDESKEENSNDDDGVIEIDPRTIKRTYERPSRRKSSGQIKSETLKNGTSSVTITPMLNAKSRKLGRFSPTNSTNDRNYHNVYEQRTPPAPSYIGKPLILKSSPSSVSHRSRNSHLDPCSTRSLNFNAGDSMPILNNILSGQAISPGTINRNHFPTTPLTNAVNTIFISNSPVKQNTNGFFFRPITEKIFQEISPTNKNDYETHLSMTKKHVETLRSETVTEENKNVNHDPLPVGSNLNFVDNLGPSHGSADRAHFQSLASIEPITNKSQSSQNTQISSHKDGKSTILDDSVGSTDREIFRSITQIEPSIKKKKSRHASSLSNATSANSMSISVQHSEDAGSPEKSSDSLFKNGTNSDPSINSGQMNTKKSLRVFRKDESRDTDNNISSSTEVDFSERCSSVLGNFGHVLADTEQRSTNSCEPETDSHQTENLDSDQFRLVHGDGTPQKNPKLNITSNQLISALLRSTMTSKSDDGRASEQLLNQNIDDESIKSQMISRKDKSENSHSKFVVTDATDDIPRDEDFHYPSDDDNHVIDDEINSQDPFTKNLRFQRVYDQDDGDDSYSVLDNDGYNIVDGNITTETLDQNDNQSIENNVNLKELSTEQPDNAYLDFLEEHLQSGLEQGNTHQDLNLNDIESYHNVEPVQAYTDDNDGIQEDNDTHADESNDNYESDSYPFKKKRKRSTSHRESMAGKRKRKRVSMVCEHCQGHFISRGGYEGHISWCGKSENSRFGLCRQCGYLTSWSLKKAHERSCPGTPASSDNIKGKEEGSSKKADSKSSFREETTDNDDEDDPEVPSTVPQNSKSSIPFYQEFFATFSSEKSLLEIPLTVSEDWHEKSDNSQRISCYYNRTCSYTSSSYEDISAHSLKCPNAAPLYSCSLCSVEPLVFTLMYKHLLSAHYNKILDFTLERKRAVRTFVRQGSTFVAREESVLSTLVFRKENYSDCLFSEWIVNCRDWHSVKRKGYEPINIRSPYFAILGDEGEIEWNVISLYESCNSEDNSYMFFGDFITASAFCPMPDMSIDQYLAVSTTSDEKYCFKKPTAFKNLIQIWNCSNLTYPDDRVRPKLVLGIAHDYGFSSHLQWCPSGIYEDVDFDASHGGRLGALASACSDGNIYIWLIPHPSLLMNEDDNCLFSSKPRVILSQNSAINASNAIATKFDWLPNKGHSLIGASFTDGSVLIWDLNTKSPLLRSVSDDGIVNIYPCKSAYCHNGTAEAFAWSPDTGTNFATGGSDRLQTLWDVESDLCRVSTIRRETMTDVHWPLNSTTTVFQMDDYGGGGGCSLRECGYLGSNLVHTKNNFINYVCGINNLLSVVVHVTSEGCCNVFACGKDINKAPMDKTYKKFHFNYPVELKPVDESSDTKSQEKLGVVFNNYPSLTIEPIPLLTYHQRLASKTYPMLAGTSLSLNENIGSHHWIFVGYRCGLGRLINMSILKKE